MTAVQDELRAYAMGDQFRDATKMVLNLVTR